MKFFSQLVPLTLSLSLSSLSLSLFVSLYLFLSLSPFTRYPLILSIENHCCVEQQHKMADYLMSVFGDSLYTDPVDESITTLPSPLELKGKVFVKV